jgi:hypothetical protein
MPTEEQDRRVRRKQLELAIDHRLGRDFPREKREALWNIMEDVENRRLRMVGRYLLSRLFRGRKRPLVGGAQGLARIMVDRFAEVLDDQELESFFELKGGSPTLPVDLNGC